MSLYTTQLRWVVEMNSTNGKTISEKCAEAAPAIFPEKWEFYDDDKKLEFETAFLRHFYMQEICCETVGLWKVFLEDWLYTNMPFFNQKLSAMAKEYDFMNDFDYVETSVDNEAGNNERNSKRSTDTDGNEHTKTNDSGTGHSFNKTYDFPSNTISEISDHITSGNETDSTANNESTSTATRSENVSENVDENGNHTINRNAIIKRTGRAGHSPGDMLKSYYSAIQNVYSEIFKTAEVLFMGVW